MYQPDTEMLFPIRVAPALRSLRGLVWRRLVDRALAAPEASPEQLGFCLMMVRLASCLTCHTDSYRALHGCTHCAIQVVRRYRGDDEELEALHARARADVAQFLESSAPPAPRAGWPGYEVTHDR